MSAPSRRYPGWRSCSRGLAGNSREMASQWTPGNQPGFEMFCTVHWHKKLIIPSRSCEQPRSFGSWCSQWQSIQTSSVCTTTRSSLAICELKLCIFDNNNNNNNNNNKNNKNNNNNNNNINNKNNKNNNNNNNNNPFEPRDLAIESLAKDHFPRSDQTVPFISGTGQILAMDSLSKKPETSNEAESHQPQDHPPLSVLPWAEKTKFKLHSVKNVALPPTNVFEAFHEKLVGACDEPAELINILKPRKKQTSKVGQRDSL